MKSHRLRAAVTTFALGAATLAGAQETERTLAIIGDSIAQATHTNDDCGERDIIRCLRDRLLATDTEYSFVAGSQPWALRNVLGFDAIEDRSRNGARWDDALEQAQAATARGALDGAVVLLGGNDVCRSAGESPPPLDEVEAHVDATLAHLTGTLRARSTVYLSDVPDVVQLFDLMAEREDNLVFENCQATWDVDYARIDDAAIEDACEVVFGPVCDGPLGDLLLEEGEEELVSTIQSLTGDDVTQAGGSCGNVLASSATPASRAEARAFNVAMNAMLARKAAEYDRRNGVRIVFAEALFEQQLEARDISRIDCFHPSRVGQERIATELAAAIAGVLRTRAAEWLVPLLPELLDEADAPQ